MNFWQLNRKMILVLSLMPIMVGFGLVYTNFPVEGNGDRWLWAACLSLFMLCTLYLVFFIPAITSFKVIRRLTEDTGEFSILPLFDAAYTIGVQHEKSWFFFTTPCIHALISGWPVIISYSPNSRSDWSYIYFRFYPLMREGSKRIYSDSISFTLRLKKRLQKDVKPDVLQCVDRIKNSGLASGAGKAISTKHFDAYD